MKSTLMLVVLSAASGMAAAQMKVDFEWKRADRCATVSPALTVAGIPAGAKTLEVKLIDHDMTSYNHGGGTVPATEGTTQIAAGALTGGYRGPCPPNFGSFGHDYQFTVRALDAGGTALETAATTKNFSASKVPQ